MFNKTIPILRKGAIQGILVAFLTGLISPLFIDGINFTTELINHEKIVLPFLIFPELYLVTFIIAFVCYLLPCIVLGVILEYLFNRSHFRILMLIVISGISSYFIWAFAFRAFVSGLYIPILVIMVGLFHYLCFLIWRRSALI